MSYGGGLGYCPQDGPNKVYVPVSIVHWESRGIPYPSFCYPCNDASAQLSPSIGADAMVQAGVGTGLYQQNVAGWDGYFIGQQNSNVVWNSPSYSAVDGEPLIGLIYVWIASIPGQRRFISLGGVGTVGTGPVAQWFLQAGVNDTIRVVSNNGGAVSSPIVIGSVMPVLLYRNSTENAALYGSIKVSQASWTGAMTQAHQISSPNTDVEQYIRTAAFWRGDRAQAVIDAGLCGPLMLTHLGWS